VTLWLLEQEFARTFEQARARSVPTGDQLVAFERITAASSSIASIAGSVCEIPIVGVLTKSRDRFAWFMGVGNTTYRDIIAALAEAQANASIKNVVLRIDSPGGAVDGLFEAIDAIAACTKPVVAVCDLAASAAYGLASAAKRIEASNRASSFGSIGVATSYSYWNSETLVDLTNTDSPNKRPDARTDAGKAVIVKQLDDIAALFMDSIARGRSTTAAVVKSTYGRGAMLLASAAKQAGMIDGVRGASVSAARAHASQDRGDQLVALLDGAQPDLGDQIMAAYNQRYGGSSRAKRLPQSNATRVASPAPPADHDRGEQHADTPDLGDQIMAAYEQRYGRIPSAKPATADRGDRLVALLDGEPIESDPVAGAPQARDLGDQIMDAYYQRFGRSSANRPPAASAEQLNAQSPRNATHDVLGVPPAGHALAYARNTLIPLMRGESHTPPGDEGDEADQLMARWNRVDARVRTRRAAMR
jgi:ClpP class serine protease